jgi:hypothetical protein
MFVHNYPVVIMATTNNIQASDAYLILPTAMPTTAHIRCYMILDHVELNKGSGWHCRW